MCIYIYIYNIYIKSSVIFQNDWQKSRACSLIGGFTDPLNSHRIVQFPGSHNDCCRILIHDFFGKGWACKTKTKTETKTDQKRRKMKDERRVKKDE